MAGRPSKRTPEREARLLEALRAGNTRQASCRYASISDETFANWQRRSLEFLEAVQKAEADAEVSRIARIALAGQQGSWQADAWWLERRRPDAFGRPYLQSETQSDAPPVHVTVIFDRADQTIDHAPTLSLGSNGHAG